MLDIILLLLCALVMIYVFVSIVKSCHTKKLEKFEQRLGLKNTYIEEFPYIDNQKMWYSEFPNSVFKNNLTKKKFIIKKDTKQKKTLTQYIETWINNIKGLQKPKSNISVKTIMKTDNDQYEILIHRNGRNHGKIIKLNMKEENESIIITNVNILGVKNEYEIPSDALFNDVGDIELNYKFEDMWKITDDEILIKDSIERISVHDL
jgi:hypothetical protein